MKNSKILYVEDEIFLGKIVKDSLETRDFEVVMVSDGKQVMSVFEKFSPDICVLDVMLPNQDGFSLAQAIRKINPHLPILFVTAKTQTEDVLKGFQSGGNDYIKKPFSLEELIARINNLLQITSRKANPFNGTIQIGKYELNPEKYELKIGEQIKKLSAREVELFKIFAENQNIIINRKEILLRVWNDDSFFNSRNLDVYITRMRDYLKEDEKIEILSIKGVGYHFLVGK
ncbi:MAG: response regulator transcription factor [Thermoflexibacter sp.]|jgi:DNA-binding response OmpR family regulator|nr:response regulator transcription factor [Thermoflexibacter sp.]